ncbi:MAG: DNA-protecting protein DprA [Candidatus Portnoybacteria bacterium CG10_big_fil_rev_8_21_14_0_10_38_18]|uniref:DNA-protecting protein DprA n=1 Tax=Candidatus Portnoybacteria bacterium CG10_big_fil_rev_8_21_14_0_10_38_18 TaxID=1974813 RepID=A0A2M8KCQ5_9BACT|nr:MAG: DNA-protecting protein DprA [Candidatus Portnoybacteria bacterium CG10_big_fil_rev_8_21_14_0_10_38_18]
MSIGEVENIRKITLQDKNYPAILKEIHNPPKELYIKGEIINQDKVAIGVVGTRKYTQYGKQACLDIAGKLARLGITIVSGLAKGIDTWAHQAALEQGGRTIAVLGSGLDKKSFYPSSNYSLSEKICQQGAMISEYPPGTRGTQFTFPQRNRIISGLSLGVVVIEAPEESGALITAALALEQNREVFAIPGSIYEKNTQGTNQLIKMGAKLVTDVEDILDELNLSHLLTIEKKKIKPENKEEEIILSILSAQPIHIDEIIKNSELPASTVNSVLMILELKKAVRNLGRGNYILCG